MANITIKAMPCDIIKVKADVCVSSLHRSKNMTKGFLASYIKDCAGTVVQDQLNELQVCNGRDLQHGEVVETVPGNLGNMFTKLMFVCLYRWKAGNEQTLEAAVKECLENASQNGFRSIVFPALGMGGLHYPPFNVAKSIVIAVIKFIQANPDTTLQTVFIALKDKDENSRRTFLQTTFAVLAGVELGREMHIDDRFTCEGLECFKGLESTKPEVNTQATKTKPGQMTTSNSGIFGWSYEEQYKCFNFKLRPQASLTDFTIGVTGEVNLDLSGYLPGFVKSLLSYGR